MYTNFNGKVYVLTITIAYYYIIDTIFKFLFHNDVEKLFFSHRQLITNVIVVVVESCCDILANADTITVPTAWYLIPIGISLSFRTRLQ